MINLANSHNTQYSQAIVVGHNHAIIVRCGLVGATGQDGAMNNADVISVINSHLNSDPATDGIVINNGNISVVIETLPVLPI